MNKKNQKVIEDINERLGNIRLEDINKSKSGRLKFAMYINAEMMNTDILDLELSVRSYNCLKRSGYETVGQLVDSIEGMEQLRKIRNLGKKSADEIMLTLFLYQYTILKQEKKQAYINRFKEMNGVG